MGSACEAGGTGKPPRPTPLVWNRWLPRCAPRRRAGHGDLHAHLDALRPRRRPFAASGYRGRLDHRHGPDLAADAAHRRARRSIRRAALGHRQPPPPGHGLPGLSLCSQNEQSDTWAISPSRPSPPCCSLPCSLPPACACSTPRRRRSSPTSRLSSQRAGPLVWIGRRDTERGSECGRPACRPRRRRERDWRLPRLDPDIGPRPVHSALCYGACAALARPGRARPRGGHARRVVGTAPARTRGAGSLMPRVQQVKVTSPAALTGRGGPHTPRPRAVRYRGGSGSSRTSRRR